MATKKITVELLPTEKEILLKALELYAEEFKNYVEKHESEGKHMLFGKNYGYLMQRDISMKLKLEEPLKEKK